MKKSEMNKFIKHIETYFQQDDTMVLHPLGMDPHIDVLLYAPNEAYPYWKLVTMGASDYKMPAKKAFIADRNEYMMFIDPEEDLNDEEVRRKYHSYLMRTALYPLATECYVTYGHSIEWEPDEDEEMICAYLEMPQIIEDPRVLRCKLGLTKTTACLQAVLLTREETDKLLEIGPQEFSNFLYPEDDSPCHFICELKRSEKF